jgi:NADH-quinone oxidoreductase subunit F
MTDYINHIVEKCGTGKDAVIPILQAIQKQNNYLPEEALKYVCANTDITPAEITGVASFYSQFRFHPAGKHIVKVCVGTACHVKGADLVYDALKRNLHIADEQDTDAEGEFTIEKVSCLGCCSLAPAVQVDNITYGHVTPVNTKSVIEDFISRKSDQNKQNKAENKQQVYQGEIRIGLGSCCIASGSDEILQAVEATVSRDNLNVNIKHVGCVGMCHQVPLVEVVPANKPSSLYAKVKPEDIKHMVEKHFKSPSLITRFKNQFSNILETIRYETDSNAIESYSIDVREKNVMAFLGNQVPIATEHRGIINPTDLDEYLSRGGFKGLKNALSMQPGEIVEAVKSSGIKGRGGAGFPTGKKWETVAAQISDEKYLICNGDEGDPGAFMDRMLLESYPYRIIEGMLIAARATGATQGYFYIRAEYPLAVVRIKDALKKCLQKGYLGDNICDSGFGFNIKIKEGAGAFVCGEETALIASIEGKRGFPRFRPPYPAIEGLRGKPTLINNTETFAQIPYILSKGPEKFASIGTEQSKGTKVFALAGKINRGGLIEVPMGITVRQIVDDIGGGVQNGKKLKAVQIGGPSGGCIPHFLADRSIDFESLEEVGAMMGSGGLVVLDETDCMVEIARYFLSFTQDESCGKCTFCRVGTKRMLDIMESITSGKATGKDLIELENIAIWTKKGSLCGLGKTAPNPVLSTLRYFRDEYMAHLNGYCPTGKCKPLINYSVNDNCIGCTICAQQCPVDAIPFNPHQKHVIDMNLCTKCDICREACPSNAIDVK